MQTKIDKPTNLFVIISMLYCSALVFSNVIAGKMVALFGTVLPAAVIVFPLVYIISDVMTEIYGYKLSMRVILTNAVIQIMMALIFMLTVALPHPVFFENQEAYVTVLGQVPRTVIASIIAYLVGDWLNTLVLSKMKVWTKGRCFFLRALGSTVVGQFFDAGIFMIIAFLGTFPFSTILTMIFSQYAFKCVYEIIGFPITKIVVTKIKKIEGIDVYDN